MPTSLNEYVEKLNSGEEADRIFAAEDIGYLNTNEAVAPIVERLSTETSRAVRDAIFQSLMRIDGAASIEGAISLLASDHPQVRNQAVDVLRHKGEAAVPFLKIAIREGNKHVRKMVLDVLIGFRATGVEDIYAASLADADINVAITAVENLGKIRAADFRLQIEELLQNAGSNPMLTGACLEALAGIGDERSLAAIHRRFPSMNALPAFLLPLVLKTMGTLGGEKEFVEVAGLLSVRNPQQRPAVLGALVAIHLRRPALHHADVLLPAVRACVAETAGSSMNRYQAVRSFSFLASREDVYSFLVECLANPERLVRLGAIEALRATIRPDLQNVFAAHALLEKDEEVLQALRP
jgi:HEAT repeat protein